MKKMNPNSKSQPTPMLLRTHLTKANNLLTASITEKETVENKLLKTEIHLQKPIYNRANRHR